MITPDQIKQWIEKGMACEQVSVEGDGRHFEAVVVSELFSEKKLIERHRMVYEALGDRMKSDIHALSLQTQTPQEHTA
jgi:acid stress-induced BolA-like protein IbaG/YrbA